MSFSEKINNLIRNIESPPPEISLYSGLIDTNTGAVLTISRYIPVVGFLTECTDAQHFPNVNSPNYRDDFFLLSTPPEKYPEWSWNKTTRLFVPTHPDILTPELRALSALMEAKRETITRVIQSLKVARSRLQRTGLEFQDIIYLTKRYEAETFKNTGYDEERITEFPFVLQYADYADLSLRQATDDILLKAKMDEELLLKTELLRLQYFNQLKAAKKLEELPKIYDSFLKDCFVNNNGRNSV